MRWATVVGVFLLSLVVSVSALAVGGTFTDDDVSVFESDIEWLASMGVTKGCNPPDNTLFCPDDAVTRGQMAAFLHRYWNTSSPRGAAALVGEGLLPPDTYERLATVSMTVPASGGQLMVTGMTNVFCEETCLLAAGLLYIDVDGGGDCAHSIAGMGTYFTEWVANPSTASAVPISEGTHRVDLCALSVSSYTGDYLGGALEVVWVPNGATGPVAPLLGDSDQPTLDELAVKLASRAASAVTSP